MESEHSPQSSVNDEIIDQINEYPPLLGYLRDCGLAIENELTFNGDIELARKYDECEAASALIDLFHAGDSHVALNSSLQEENTLMRIENEEPSGSSYESKDEVNVAFLLPLYSPPKLQITTLRKVNEPRMKYLLRSLKLWQELRNSGDMEKLKVLLDDTLTEECLMFLHSTLPPIIGRQKIYEQNVSYNQNIPDLCLFHNNIVRTKKRVITFNANSFGTLPYANANDRTTWSWNFFESVPIEKLDEHHQLQKQKYDTLKSQNKVIKFERKCVWFAMLSRDLKHITKIMATDIKVDIY